MDRLPSGLNIFRQGSSREKESFAFSNNNLPANPLCTMYRFAAQVERTTVWMSAFLFLIYQVCRVSNISLNPFYQSFYDRAVSATVQSTATDIFCIPYIYIKYEGNTTRPSPPKGFMRGRLDQQQSQTVYSSIILIFLFPIYLSQLFGLERHCVYIERGGPLVFFPSGQGAKL